MAGARGSHKSAWTCLHCDNRDSDEGKSLVSFLPRFAHAQNAYIRKARNGGRCPAGLEEGLQGISMHMVDNFTVGLRAFDLSVNSGPCTLHLFDCNFSKKIIKWIGGVLAKEAGGVLEEFNARLFFVGSNLAKTFETTGYIRGKCLLPRKTGADIRELMDIIPFALVGVVKQGTLGWLLDLTISWTRLRELVNSAEAGDFALLAEIDERVAICRPLLRRLCEQGCGTSVDDQPTYHQLVHLSLCAKRAGSLRELATDGFENFHQVVKSAFLNNTNRALKEEVVVPQVMRSLAKRDFGSRPVVPAKVIRTRVGVVNGRKIILEKALEEVNRSWSIHVRVSAFCLLEHVLSRLDPSDPASDLMKWFGSLDVRAATPAMLKRVVVSVGTGAKTPVGRLNDYRGSKNTLVRLNSGRFAVVVLVAEFPFQNAQSLGLDCAIFCKYVEDFMDGDVFDDRFGLPCLVDSLDFNRQDSYVLVNGQSIESVWSLMPVASPDERGVFYARKTLE